jgi:hypothetical protein
VIVIGCARNLRFHPRACDAGQLVLLVFGRRRRAVHRCRRYPGCYWSLS